MTKLTKSKQRVRDHGEVFTPGFIVEDMLDLVFNETQRIESRFLEPACGDGNFLIKVLDRKLKIVEKNYKKNQFDFEKYALIAVSSIYGIELLEDNTIKARERLSAFVIANYEKLFKKQVNSEFIANVKYLLSKNIIQGNALTLRTPNKQPIVFSEWSLATRNKIKRRDFQFSDLTASIQKQIDITSYSVQELSDSGEVVFSPIPVKEYPLVNFMSIYESYE